MAKLSVSGLDRPMNWPKKQITKKIGHNRTMYLDEEELILKLHGHTLLRYNTSQDTFTVYTQGFHSRTTAQAIKDFFRAFGKSVGISFAKNQARIFTAAGVFALTEGMTFHFDEL